ncbi:MAG: bifunctional oligoribonuclease/PAP phosphatase NrnA [Bacteroidetes bacterium]|nr:bifunctional oligoribonuclease/PAP phosphatase NrnA [Bacteroidota bacterium]
MTPGLPMLAELIDALQNAHRVVISTHTRPDGDAIGSQLALGAFLRAKGKQVWMINADPVPYNLEWLPGADAIRVYDHSVELVEAMASADAVIIVDTNAVSRLGTPGNQLKGASGRRILIDHHTDPETWFDLTYRRESASSTGELLYELMAGGDLAGITAEAAVALYVAILTDTGSFRFAQVTPTLHRMTADLLERSAMNPSDIYARVYDRKSPEGMKLLASVLSTQQLHFDGRVGMLLVTQQMLEDTGAPVEETDGFVNMLLSIEGVAVALLFTETAKGTKISFRSKGDWEVHRWAQHFGGGGHRNAAGAFVKARLDDTIQQTINTAPRFLDVQASEDGPELSEEDAAYLAMLGGGS